MGKKVIAIGNEMMKDDGVGISVAKELKDYFRPRDIEIIIGETDVDYCLDCIEDNDDLIILDASFEEGDPGRVNVNSLENLCTCHRAGITQHQPSLLEAIRVYKKGVQGILIAIEIAEIAIGLGLSERMNRLLPQVVEDVKKSIEVYIGGREMHDTVLLGKISQELEKLCIENNILKIESIVVEVNQNSHVNSVNLKEHLMEYNAPIVGEWTEVLVVREDIEDQSAVISSLKGETMEKEK